MSPRSWVVKNKGPPLRTKKCLLQHLLDRLFHGQRCKENAAIAPPPPPPPSLLIVENWFLRRRRRHMRKDWKEGTFCSSEKGKEKFKGSKIDGLWKREENFRVGSFKKGILSSTLVERTYCMGRIRWGESVVA